MSLIRQIIAMPFSLRQKRLAKERAHLSECDFMNQIVDAGGDREAARLLHSKLQEWVYVDGFTIHPDDSLERIFGIAEEELDEDFILEILDRIRLSPPSDEAIVLFGKVSTPIDIARLVNIARSE